jgi:tetratricopeptide (TPR) repeat protein
LPGRSRRREWLFRLIALTVVPLMILIVLEIALRMGGYGHSTGFFRRVRVGNEAYLRENDGFALRFFPPELTRAPSAIFIRESKPTNTFRIFILGESAAMGDPEPAFGAGRYLQVLLNERYPGMRFEIVNTGVTAINSHVIRAIARDCAREQGDLWIIYMGNNEMVGPYGAATVFGAQAPPLALVRFKLAAEQTRIGQLAMNVAGKIRGRKNRPAPSWGGMQMFTENQVMPDDPRKETVYRNFQANLEDILKSGTGAGTIILLNNVAVNLKDCPPLAATGTNSADAEFRQGETLLSQTNFAAARDAFQKSCDDDALPFRADSRINGILADAGRRFADQGVVFVDATAALEKNSAAGILGQETFYEHVHFNFDGSYRLARVWADQIEKLLPPAITTNGRPGWASQFECERRLALTDWNRGLVIKSVIERLQAPPLNSQFNNPQRLQALRELAGRWTSRESDAVAATDARAIYSAAIERDPTDYYLHENFAEFLQLTGDAKGAVSQWQLVRAQLPEDGITYFQLGRALEQQGQLADAETAMKQALVLRPYLAEAWYELASVYFAEGKYETAVQTYLRAGQLRPNDPRIYYDLGRALSLLKRSDESIENFRQAIRLNPAYWQARYALGGELGMHDRIPEARVEFEQVIQQRPDFAPAHLNLGVAWLKLGQLDAARQEFEETLRLDPGDQTARSYLERTQGTGRQR